MNIDLYDKIKIAVMDAIGGCAYDCIRDWSAWSHGTMRRDDFIPIIDDGDRIHEIVDAVAYVLRQEPIEQSAAWKSGLLAGLNKASRTFYPKERTGYETKEAMDNAHKAIQEMALRSFPGANGDPLVALSMLSRQQQSVIDGAKNRIAHLIDETK